MNQAHQITLQHAKAHRILRQDIAKKLNPHNITVLEWLLLCSLEADKHGLRLSQLADHIGVEAPLVSQLLTSLQKKKLVRLSADKDDRRAKRLMLTTAGQRIVVKSSQAVNDELTVCLREVTAPDLEAHLRVLDAVIAHDD